MRKFIISLLTILTLTSILFAVSGCKKSEPTDYEGTYLAGDNGSLGELRLNSDATFSLKYKKGTESKSVTGTFIVQKNNLKLILTDGKTFKGSATGDGFEITFDGINFVFIKKIADGGIDDSNNNGGTEDGETPPTSGFNCDYFYTSTFSDSEGILRATLFSKNLSPYTGNSISTAPYGYNIKSKISYKKGFSGKIYLDEEKTVEVTDGILPINFTNNFCYVVVNSETETEIKTYKFNAYLTKEYILEFYDVDVVSGVESIYKKLSVYENQVATTFSPPTQKNVTFSKWITSEGETYDMSNAVTADRKLYARYDKVVLTFVWEINNNRNVYVTRDTACLFNDIPVPALDGYELVGWADIDENMWDNTRLCNENIMLFAIWRPTKIDEFFTFKYDEQSKSYTLIAFLGNSVYVKIPDTYTTDTYGEAPVTAIAENVFKGKAKMTNVHIPQTVTYIGSSAFKDCNSLISVTIPNGVTALFASTFAGCSRLTEVVLPEGMLSIGNSAFSGCSSLQTIVLPTTLTGLGESAFYKCSSMKRIAIPQNVKNIYASTFSGCFMLTEIILPTELEKINKEAFKGCANLKEIFVPKTVAYIGANAFTGCISLTIKLEIAELPMLWDKDWNSSGCNTVWDAKK